MPDQVPDGVTFSDQPPNSAAQPGAMQMAPGAAIINAGGPSGPPPGVSFGEQPVGAGTQEDATQAAIHAAAGTVPGGEAIAGAAKGAYETGIGAASLLAKGLQKAGIHSEEIDALASGDLSPFSKAMTTPEGAEQHVGEAGEGMAEWLSGEEALKGVANFAKIAGKAPQLIRAMEKYPKTAKLIQEMVLGTAQGGVKGAAQGEAEAGAVGGGVGAGIASGVGNAIRPIAKALGLGGFTSEEAITKAGKPYVGEINWKDSVERALPTIAAVKDKFNNLGEFIDVLHDEAAKLWDGTIVPQVDRAVQHLGNPDISTNDIAQSIRQSKPLAWAALPSVFGAESKAADAIAADLDQFNLKMPQVMETLKALNAKLRGYYNMPPAMRAAGRITDGELQSLEQASNGLRDKLFKMMEAAGEQTPGEFRKTYGALKDLGRVFGKRLTVEERQAPMSLPIIIGLMRAGEGILGGSVEKVISGEIGRAHV